MKPQMIKGKAFVSIFNGGVVKEGLGITYGIGIGTWQEFFNRQLWPDNEAHAIKLSLVDKAELALDLLERAGYEVILISPAPERFRLRIESFLHFPVNLLSSYNTPGGRQVVLKPWSYTGAESDADWTAAMIARARATVFIGPKEVQAVLKEIAPEIELFANFTQAAEGTGPLAKYKKSEVPNNAA